MITISPIGGDPLQIKVYEGRYRYGDTCATDNKYITCITSICEASVEINPRSQLGTLKYFL